MFNSDLIEDNFTSEKNDTSNRNENEKKSE